MSKRKRHTPFGDKLRGVPVERGEVMPLGVAFGETNSGRVKDAKKEVREAKEKVGDAKKKEKEIRNRILQEHLRRR